MFLLKATESNEVVTIKNNVGDQAKLNTCVAGVFPNNANKIRSNNDAGVLGSAFVAHE